MSPTAPSGRMSTPGRTPPLARSTSKPNPAQTTMKTSGNRTQAAKTLIELGLAPLPPAQSENAQEEGAEEDLDPDDDQRGGQHREPRLGERAEPAIGPDADDHARDDQPGHDDEAPEQQPVLQ